MQRREFLAAGAGLLAAGCLNNRVYNTPFSLQPLGLQLYTVRDLMQRDFEGTLRAVAAAGYAQVEFAGYFDHTPAQVRAALSAAGLTAPAAHVDGDLMVNRWAETVERAVAVGHRYVVIAWIPQQMRGSLDAWRRIAELMNRCAEMAGGAGIQLGYHNHDYVFPVTEGRVPYDVLLESTDPATVKFEMDVYWTRKGGADPLAYFARWPGRFPMLHVKDLDAAGNMVDVGQGIIDWRAIVAQRAAAGTEHFFVEHDDPPNPLQSIAASYRYLRSL